MTLTDDSDSDSDSDSDGNEEYYRKRRHSKKKKTKAKPKKAPLTQIKPDEPMCKVSSPPEEEVEGLIQQLNTMSLEDPKYGLLYYKALKNDPMGLAAQCSKE